MKTEIEAALRQKIENAATNLIIQASRAVIQDDETLSRGADLQKIIKTQIKKADEERKEYVGPLNSVVKKINGDFKTMVAPLQKAADALSGKMTAYVMEREKIASEERRRAAREAEERALKDAEALQAAGRSVEADEVISQGASVASAVTAAHTAPVRCDYGAVASVRKEWTFELENMTEVPPKYLLLDSSEVRNAIREAVSAHRADAKSRGLSGDVAEAFVQEAMGNFKIPGLRIHQKVSSMVR